MLTGDESVPIKVLNGDCQSKEIKTFNHFLILMF